MPSDRILLIHCIMEPGTVPVACYPEVDLHFINPSNLAVDIEENGDAEISVDYSLTWVERVVVFMRIAHPDTQLEQALEGYSGKEVTVSGVSPTRTELFVEEFVQVDEYPEGTIYTTPSMDFSFAEQQARDTGSPVS